MRKIECLLAAALVCGAASAQALLTNEVIVRMVKAGVSDEVIVTMVGDRLGQYSLTTNDLVALKQAGVSDKIIGAMVGRGAAPTTPTALLAPAIVPSVLHDSTPVRLRLTRNLSSADAKSGDTLDFEVLDDVKVDDVLVIARGATAIGTVTEAQAKRRMARGGKLDITIDYVRLVNGDKAALRGVKETSGGGHTGAMTGAIVATSLVVWPAAPFFLFMHGKDTNIPKGTEITAYVNGEIKLNGAATIAQAAGLIARVDAPRINAEPVRKTSELPVLGSVYENIQNPADRLQLNPDGAFSLQEGGQWFSGTYLIGSNTLKLHIVQLQKDVDIVIKGNTLIVNGIETWVQPSRKGNETTGYVNGEVKLNSSPVNAQAAQPVARVNAPNIDPESLRKPETQPVAGGRIIVHVTSAPANAEVDIDGSYWGTTPTADLTRLQAGTHTIVVKRLGYKPWERKIDLAVGDDRTVNAELEIDPSKPHIAGL